MSEFLPTIILRHRKENLKKCSLTGLEKKAGFDFYTYPKQIPQKTANYVVLSMEGDLLSEKESPMGLYLIDATWSHAERMNKMVPEHLPRRSLPPHFRTAYPRRQTGCSDAERGLASIEALYIAYFLTKRPLKGLLDHYHFKDEFLRLNLGYFGNDLNDHFDSNKGQ